MGRSSPAAPGGGGGDGGGRGPPEPEDDPASTSFAAGGGWLGAGAVRFAAKAENAAKGKSAAAAPAASSPSSSSSSRPRHRGHHLSDADLDEPVPRELTDLAAPHVESFDAFLERGLDLVVKRLPAVEVKSWRGEGEREGASKERPLFFLTSSTTPKNQLQQPTV